MQRLQQEAALLGIAGDDQPRDRRGTPAALLRRSTGCGPRGTGAKPISPPAWQLLHLMWPSRGWRRRSARTSGRTRSRPAARRRHVAIGGQSCESTSRPPGTRDRCATSSRCRRCVPGHPAAARAASAAGGCSRACAVFTSLRDHLEVRARLFGGPSGVGGRRLEIEPQARLPGVAHHARRHARHRAAAIAS